MITTTAGYWSKDTLAPEGATLLLQAGDTEQLSNGWRMTMGALKKCWMVG